MSRSATATRSATRLFLVYAAVSAVPVLLIGLVLAGSYRSEADRRGLEEGRAQAAVIASTAIEPLLTSADLRSGMSPEVRSAIDNVADRAVDSGVVMRLRVRDLDGDVVYSQDGSGLEEAPEDDAVEAAEGHVHSEITRLNADANDSGPLGPQVVEVYMPLSGGSAGTRVGVLEVYLPVRPDPRGHRLRACTTLYRDLAVGLLALYLVLAGIALVTTRRLQQQARRNAYLAEHDQLTGLPNRRGSWPRSPSSPTRRPTAGVRSPSSTSTGSRTSTTPSATTTATSCWSGSASG